MCGLHVPVGSGISTAAGVEVQCFLGWQLCSCRLGVSPSSPIGTSKLEFQNGSLQHQEEQGKMKLQKWFLPAPFFLERAPTDSCLSGRYFEISES